MRLKQKKAHPTRIFPTRIAQTQFNMSAPLSWAARLDAWLWPVVDVRRAWTPRFTAGCLSRAASRRSLLAWRALSASWMLGVQLWAWGRSLKPDFHLAYLTHDGMWLNIAYFCVSVGLTLTAAAPGAAGCACTVSRDSSSAWGRRVRLHAHRLAQVLLAVALSWETIIVLLFWVLLFRGTPDGEEPGLYYFSNVVIHGSVAVHPWVDLVVGSNTLPDRLSLPVLGASVLYLLLNLGVSRSLRPVYPVLTWTRGGDAVLVLGTLLLILAVFFAGAWVAHALERCSRRGRGGGGGGGGPCAGCAFHSGGDADAEAGAAGGAQPRASEQAAGEGERERATGAPKQQELTGALRGCDDALALALADPWCERVPLQGGAASSPCGSCKCPCVGGGRRAG